MSKVNVIFSYKGRELKIQCLKKDKMKDICQKFANKILLDLNSLLFLYGGAQINFKLSFSEQANSIDRKYNEMKIVVFDNEKENENEKEGFVCPKCGEKIELDTEKINNIISANNNIKDTINGIKIQIENIIQNNTINLINAQLKNINLILNTLDEDLKKNNKVLENLFDNNDRKINDKIENNSMNELEINETENYSLKKKKKYYSNDIISIRIVTPYEDLDEIIECSKNDIFTTVEKKLYRKYEKYKNTENNFLLNGSIINRFRTINENKIEDGDKIILFIGDDY